MHDRRPKQPCFYILASARDGVLYAGVTSDLAKRVAIHKQDLLQGFTKRYGVHRLVYYEMHETMPAAILRETQVKKWKRTWKVRLIQSVSPAWIDLFDEGSGEVRMTPADVERECGRRRER